MEATQITNALLSILEKNGPIPGQTPAEQMSFRYLDSGHIDSLSIINFIFEVEEVFGVNLSPEDTQSDEFRTVGGLTSLINQKIHESPRLL